MKTKSKKTITVQQQKELFTILKKRFDENKQRHKGLEWKEVMAKLEKNDSKIRSLYEMERTGGEPDVIAKDNKTGEYIFCDCSAESPPGRRSVCYDHEALVSRKEHKPKNSTLGMATSMGIDLLNEAQYRLLQQLGKFDSKTSSWLKTPEDIRELGGAIFADFRFGHVFVYHNSAESYYAARGFRGMLRV
jgi:hypothetical protein